MTDLVLKGQLEQNLAAARELNRNSDTVTLAPESISGSLPRVYHGLLRGAKYFARQAGGLFAVSNAPLTFSLTFPDDYCKSVDPRLQFRVISTEPRLVHPNVQGGIVCLGGRFRPSTSLRVLVEQFYAIATARVAAIDDPFDPEAAAFFVAHLGEVRALESAPLWRRPAALHTRVEEIHRDEDPSRVMEGA